MGTSTIAPALTKSGQDSSLLVQVGEVLGHRQNQDQFDPLGRLKVPSSRHLYPAPRAQIFLPENHDAHQRDDGRDIKPVHPIQQQLVVHQADQEHAHQAAGNPVDLPDVRPGKLGVQGRAVNLHHPQPANEQDKDQENPVEITE